MASIKQFGLQHACNVVLPSLDLEFNLTTLIILEGSTLHSFGILTTIQNSFGSVSYAHQGYCKVKYNVFELCAKDSAAVAKSTEYITDNVKCSYFM